MFHEFEGAKVTAFQIKKCQPQELTIVADRDSAAPAVELLA